MNKEKLYKNIREALVEMEEELVVELCNLSLELGFDANETINSGLIKGMEDVGMLFEEEEYFLPEVLICSDAMYAGVEILRPHIKKVNTSKLKVVIGVVEGDTHDIGKNLVKIMLEAGGIEVHDLGRDIPIEDFINKAREVDARYIIMSTLMTTTMPQMKRLIDELQNRGIRDQFRVAIGGGPISSAFAKEIGADLYTRDANECVRKIKEIEKLC